jgi:hypothetical protein
MGFAALVALSLLLLQPRLGDTTERMGDVSRGGDRSALSALLSDVVLVSKPSSGSALGSIPADIPATSASLVAAFAALGAPWARGGLRGRNAILRVHARGPPIP